MKIQPSAFWSLSLVEWRWLTEDAGDGAMTTRDLQFLISQFPDEKL